MSKVERRPINIPKEVTVDVSADGKKVDVKPKKGNAASFSVNQNVTVSKKDDKLFFTPAHNDNQSRASAGTMRALVNNLIVGAITGYKIELALVGVGYKAQSSNNTLNLNIGFSHPVVYKMPTGITVTTPSPTEVVLTGTDKQLIGQVAANIRKVFPPEPYKGKGIRYKNEVIKQKEGKKK